MTPLPLTADEVRTLQETGSVETWDKMEPQPIEDPTFLGGWAWKTAAHSTSVQSLIDGLYPEHHPHPIGTSAWVQEEWCEYARLLPSDDHGKIHYHADDSHEAVKPWGDSGWQPASDMPQWASRFNVTSTAVRTERREGVWGFVTTWRRA